MIGWILKKISTSRPAARQQDEPRATSPEACAIWHDVVRALDAKPKSTK